MSKKNEPKYSPLKKFFTRLLGFLTNPSVCVGLIIFLILVVIMLVIYASEKDRNDNINTLFDAIWYTIVTITTVGYGDITPVSVFGRISAITLLVVGVAIFGALSGKFASFLLDRQQKKDRGLLTMEKMKNHFLICGWKPNFEKILEGVLIANPEVSPENIVLLNNADRSCMEVIQSKEDFKGINYIHGDFTEDATLIKAQIKTAERVLILADASENYSTLEIDSRTVLAVITIKNLNPRIYCVAEIFDSKFEKHLSLARCDEIILTKDYEQNLLVQASSGKGMSHILRELISEETKSGIILAPIPDKCVGITYGEYRESLKTKDILIGILENTGNFYMRRKEALAEAQKNPDMEKIVSNLKKVKSLKSNIPVFNPKDEYIIPDSSKAIFIHGETIEE
ncbi:MAG: NAD-binding protein [Treponema sp.]|uniref:potassium channel family protein n=1 Tax=Treponema sp. TaxID=166 RepID=UPI00298D98F6|nr:ion channel [Treponema sp.]MBR5933036.1 NAD-binding protein [Treponema sp.]